MKKFLFTSLAIGLIVAAWAFATVTETHSEADLAGRARYSAFKVCTITQDAKADFTETTEEIYGIILRITIVATGTDTSFSITLADENAKTILTKSGLSTASDPYGYAVYEDDTEGNPWAGVPVAGALSLTMADGDDATLSAITVKIYYMSFWK